MIANISLIKTRTSKTYYLVIEKHLYFFDPNSIFNCLSHANTQVRIENLKNY